MDVAEPVDRRGQRRHHAQPRWQSVQRRHADRATPRCGDDFSGVSGLPGVDHRRCRALVRLAYRQPADRYRRRAGPSLRAESRDPPRPAGAGHQQQRRLAIRPGNGPGLRRRRQRPGARQFEHRRRGAALGHAAAGMRSRSLDPVSYLAGHDTADGLRRARRRYGTALWFLRSVSGDGRIRRYPRAAAEHHHADLARCDRRRLPERNTRRGCVVRHRSRPRWQRCAAAVDRRARPEARQQAMAGA